MTRRRWRLVHHARRSLHSGVFVRSAIVLMALVGAAAAWRWTSLGDLVNVRALARWEGALRGSAWAPLLIVAGYVAGSLMLVPVTLLTVATVYAFGFVPGYAYALLGCLSGASVTFGIGRHIGQPALRRVAGPRVDRIARLASRHGLMTVVVLRVLPVAPFTVVNMVIGASPIGFGPFLLGTLLGMAPGAFGLALFEWQLESAVRAPSPVGWAVLGGLAATLALGVLGLRRWARRARPASRGSAGRLRRDVSDQEEAEGPTVIVASYNVHGCIGLDGRRRADRVAAVIRKLNADIVALQEVRSRWDDRRQAQQVAYLASATGMAAVSGPTKRTGRGTYGNLLLTRLPIQRVRHLDLSLCGREPRGAIVAELAFHGRAIRIVATHLGLRAFERAAQVSRLLEVLTPTRGGLTVVLADLNERRRDSATIRRLEARFGVAPAPPTFPSPVPLLPLDRIFVSPRTALKRTDAYAEPPARVASDHLPLRAVLALGPEGDSDPVSI